MVRHQGRSLKMLVRPDERVPIARLLRFLEQGEELARDCAKAQATLAPEAGMRSFLLGQARQEGYHAVVFRGAIAWLAPRHLGSCPRLQPLERYRTLIEDAIRRGDLAETLLAEQIILEGLGEAILKRIDAGLVKRNAPFGRLRRILVRQEEAHHEFGRRALDRAIRPRLQPRSMTATTGSMTRIRRAGSSTSSPTACSGFAPPCRSTAPPCGWRPTAKSGWTGCWPCCAGMTRRWRCSMTSALRWVTSARPPRWPASCPPPSRSRTIR